MEFSQAAVSRRTVRRFQQRPVPAAEIREILEKTRMASCAANGQRLRYIVVQESSLVRTLFETTAWGAMVRPRRTPEWGVNAPPCFIAVTAPAAEAASCQADAGAAIQLMELAAWDRGIGCCWLGGFDPEVCAEALGVDADRCILYLVAAGYPAEDPTAEDSGENVRYYLDGNDRLHVPKLTLDVIAQWR